jgi:hypothetical protein
MNNEDAGKIFPIPSDTGSWKHGFTALMLAAD